MEFVFLCLGTVSLAFCGNVTWHLLTDDDCTHPDIGQSGECEQCGERIEIGGSE